MKQGHKITKPKVKSKKVSQKFHGNDSFRRTIDVAIEQLSEMEKPQSALGKLKFRMYNNINPFKNPLPSPPKREKEPKRGLNQCHNLISSTPYCDNKQRTNGENCLLESPEGSPIQLNSDKKDGKVVKKNNSRLLDKNESLKGSFSGSSVVYVGTEPHDADATLKQIVTAPSLTKNVEKVKSGIPVKSKPVTGKNNRSRSSRSNALPKENPPKVQTEEESRHALSPDRSRTRKKKQNRTLTNLNDDEKDFVVGSQNNCNEQAASSTRANNTRDLSVLVERPSVTEPVNVEEECPTSPSPTRKSRSRISSQNESRTTVSRSRTRSGRRNKNVTLSNTEVNHSIIKNGPKTIYDEQVSTSTQMKITKGIQAARESVSFIGGTLPSAELEPDRSFTPPRSRSRVEKKKSVVRTVRRRSNRKNKSATDFNGDVESSMCDKQVGTSTQTKVTKDAQTSMELVKFAESRINTAEPTNSNDNSLPKLDIIEEIRQRKECRKIGLDRTPSSDVDLNHVEHTVNRDWSFERKKKKVQAKENFDNLISHLVKFAANSRAEELEELRQLEAGFINSTCNWPSSPSHVSTNSHASNNSSTNRRFKFPHRISPHENSCAIMNRKPVVSKTPKNSSLSDRQQALESVVFRLKDRLTQDIGVQTSTPKERRCSAPLFRRSAIKARNKTIQDVTSVPTVSCQNSIGVNIYDSVKDGNSVDCLLFSALNEDGLVENQDKPWRFSHSGKSVLGGVNITVPSFILTERQIQSITKCSFKSSFDNNADNKKNTNDKSVLPRQVLQYSSDEDSEVMNPVLTCEHRLIQSASKEVSVKPNLQRRTYRGVRQSNTEKRTINDAPDDDSEAVAKNKKSKFENQTKHRKSLAEIVSLLSKSNSSTENATPTKRNQSRKRLTNRDTPKTVDLSSDRVLRSAKNKNNALVQSGIERLSQSSARSKRDAKSIPGQPAILNYTQLQQNIPDYTENEMSALENPVSQENYNNNQLLTNRTELQKSMQDDIGYEMSALENELCVERVQRKDASEVSEAAGSSRHKKHSKTKKNRSLLVKFGIEQLSKSPDKNAAKPISTPRQPAILNYTQLQQNIPDDTDSEIPALENSVSQENYSNNQLLTNVEDTNIQFKVPQSKSTRKGKTRKTKSNNSSTRTVLAEVGNVSDATSQMSEFSSQGHSPNSKRNLSKGASKRSSSFDASHPLGSVSIVNVIPSEAGGRSLRKRTNRNAINAELIEKLGFKGKQVVLFEPITLRIPRSQSKRSKKNNKQNNGRSTSKVRTTDLPAIAEQEIENNQSGPSSSILMKPPPPPEQIPTTQQARLDELTADSGFENSNFKTSGIKDNTTEKKRKLAPSLSKDDHMSQPAVIDQESVSPTLDDPDINRDVTQCSTQPPFNDVPMEQELTAFSCKVPPLKAYKKLGNLYLYESEKPPDGSMGYIRLKPGTQAENEESQRNMTFFVIKGSCRVELENKSFTARLGPGSNCYIPKGRKYTIFNPCRSHLVIIYMKK